LNPPWHLWFNKNGLFNIFRYCVDKTLKDLTVILARVPGVSVLQGTGNTVLNTVGFAFTQVTFAADQVYLIKVNITERTCQDTHFAACAPVTVNFYSPGCFIPGNCSSRTNLKAPGITAVHAGLRQANFHIIVVFHPDV
jgi:hypothetical protein